MKRYTAFFDSPLGSLLIECSDEYLTSVLFCDADPNTQKDEHPLLNACMVQLQEYFAGERKHFSLPLKQDGTDFQIKVWDLLSRIPFGKTMSYHALAKQYGDAKSIRAVAAANGKNNLAIIVPCHRVIGSNGSLTGYAGGLWRKKWLLNHEARHSHGLQSFAF